ncbi:MAG: hypothetical protein GXO83_07370 [Chlorobi bacterium]|nr:hypothetical protein [Chlorobiota bacterium]
MNIFKFTRQVYLIQGFLFLLFGILFVAAPESILFGISIYLGVLALIPGVVMIVVALLGRSGSAMGMVLVWGLMLALLGLLLIVKPEIMAILLALFIGLWVLFNGIAQIRNALLKKSEGWNNWWIRLVAGIVLTVFGLLIMSNAFTTTVILTIWFGALMIASGIYYLIMAFTLKD